MFMLFGTLKSASKNNILYSNHIAYADKLIQLNTDVAGVGVRVSYYLQLLLLGVYWKKKIHRIFNTVF